MLARAGATSSLGRRAVSNERWEDGAGEWLERWRFSVVVGFQFYLLIYQFLILMTFCVFRRGLCRI